MTRSWKIASAILLSCLAGCGQKSGEPKAESHAKETAAPTPTPPPAGPTTTVSGTVRFEGTPPERKPVKMTADDVCTAHHDAVNLSEDTIVGEGGGLMNVFVSVVGGLEGQVFAPPANPVVLDQKGCVYTPHVFGVMAKQTINLLNSDPTLHNVHAIPAKGDGEFNVGMPRQGMEIARSFEDAGVVRFKCDVHPWMLSWGIVTTHPFYGVTDAAGHYTIAGLPSGTYAIEAWHEKLGTKRGSLTVDAAAGAATLDFAFSSAP